MKKFFSLFFVLVLSLGLSVPACALDNRFADAEELINYWDEIYSPNVYPDYVNGVWLLDEQESDSGHDVWAIGVTDDEASREGMENIRRWVADDSTYTFVIQQYSYAQLCEIKDEIVTSLSDRWEQIGALVVGPDVRSNHVCVTLNTAAPGAEEFMEECQARYGELVYFEGGDGWYIEFTDGSGYVADAAGEIISTVGHTPIPSYLVPVTGLRNPAPNPSQLLLTACLIFLAAWTVIGLHLRLLPTPLLRTAHGGVVTAAPLTRRQTEEAIRAGAVTPEDRVWQSILEKSI